MTEPASKPILDSLRGRTAPIRNFLSSHGIPPVAALFVLLVLVLAGILLASNAPPSHATVKIAVASGDTQSPLDGASVELYADETLVARTTSQHGEATFSNIAVPPGASLTARVKKDNYFDALGHAQASLSLPAGQTSSRIVLYPSAPLPSSSSVLASTLRIQVVDSLTGAGLTNAAVLVSSDTGNSLLHTDSEGTVSIPASPGVSLKIRTSLDGYFSDSRYIVAEQSTELVKLASKNPSGSLTSSSLSASPSPNPLPSASSIPSTQRIQDSSAALDSSTAPLSGVTISISDSAGNPASGTLVSIDPLTGQIIDSTPIVNGKVAGATFNPSLAYKVLDSKGLPLWAGALTVADSSSGSALFNRPIDSGASGPLKFSTLSVHISTPDGSSLPSGTLRVHDAFTGALLQSSALSSDLSIAGIAPDALVAVVANADGFPPEIAYAHFGRTASLSLTLPAAVPPTHFASSSASSQPLATSLRVYSSDSPIIPAFAVDGAASSDAFFSKTNPLSAVFSADGFLPLATGSFPSGSTVEAFLSPASSPVAAQYCITPPQGSRSCTGIPAPAQTFLLSIFVSDETGAGIPTALVSVFSSPTQALSTLSTDGTGHATIPALPAGSYAIKVFLPVSGQTSQATVDPSKSQAVTIPFDYNYGFVLATAQDAADPNSPTLAATFTVDQTGLPQQTCTGNACLMKVKTTSPFTLTASAPGFSPTSFTGTLTPGQHISRKLVLAKTSSVPLSIVLREIDDESGSPVQTLSPDRNYRLVFFLSSTGATSTALSVRMGNSPDLSREPAGILDFSLGDVSADSYSKSISYSPQPTCVDAGNTASNDGLLKWVELNYVNPPQGPLQKLVSIAIHTKPASAVSASSLSIFYRASATLPSGMLRIPVDSVLGSEASSSQKAGCYADSLSRSIALSGYSVTCPDGTAAGSCSTRNPPNSCSTDSTGALTLQPSSTCCPTGTKLDGTTCIPLSPPPTTACKDGTQEGSCSSLNIPLKCSSNALSPDASCCPAGELFSNGVCIPAGGASCKLGVPVVPPGCVPNDAPWKCDSGVLVQDAQACPCPAGFLAHGLRCIPSTCSDGTQVGVCDQNPASQPLSCGLKPGSTVPTLSYNPANRCPCPAGSQDAGGTCVACSSANCGVSTQCQFNGALVPVGCIPSNAPSRCLSDGTVRADPVACGCPSGQLYDARSSSCISASGPTCDNGLSAGAGIDSCDAANQPLQCVLSGNSGIWISNPSTCGCPAGSHFSFGACVPDSGTSSTSTTTTTTTSSTTSTAAPLQSCSTPNACLQKESSDAFCNAQGKVFNWCSYCNPTCAGSNLYSCNPTSGACEPKKCSIPLPDGTSAEQCIENSAPQRCALSSAGNAVAQENSATCGCPAGQKPDAGGVSCIACKSADCSDDSTLVCQDSSGKWHHSGECLSGSFSRGNQPILRCDASGALKADAVACGCNSPYVRTEDGLGCVLPESAPPALDVLPPSATCSGCTSNDVLSFDPVSGSLKTSSGRRDYSFQIDSVFPADAMKFSFSQPQHSGSARISIQRITSSDGIADCFSYDAASALLRFDSRPESCPVKVQGNKLYWSGGSHSGSPFQSASAHALFQLGTIPPATLDLTLTVTANAVDSIFVTPASLSGPSTPQLVFLVNEKQSLFGPRNVIPGAASSPLDFTGAGVHAIAWRGPGNLEIKEGASESLAVLSYQKVASYFDCTGQVGLRVDKCSNDFLCCANGWCTGPAVVGAARAFKAFANSLAQRTAFRRGNGFPYSAFATGTPFQVFSAAQVIEGSQGILSSNSFKVVAPASCQPNNPGVYELRAETSDGASWSYSGRTLGLTKYDYVAGTCSDDSQFTDKPPGQANPASPLCNFLYGDCQCIASVNHNIIASNTQASDSHSVPIPVPSFFTGLPPKFAGPLAPFSMQATGCVAASQAYDKAQKATDVACLAKPWATAVIGGIPLIIKNSPSIRPLINSCEDSSPQSVCLTRLEKPSPSDIESQAPPGYVYTGHSVYFTPPIEVLEFAPIPPDPRPVIGLIRWTGDTYLDQEITAINAQLLAQQLAFLPENVPYPTGACLTAFISDPLCIEEIDSLPEQSAASLVACRTAMSAEFKSGAASEAMGGNMYDFPVEFPVPRKAWSTCYAYGTDRPDKPFPKSHTSSTSVHLRCQQKDSVVQLLPFGNQLFAAIHLGLAPNCDAVRPKLLSLALAFVPNSVYGNSGIGQFAGLFALGSGFQGTQDVPGSPFVAAGDLVALLINEPLPPKGSEDAAITKPRLVDQLELAWRVYNTVHSLSSQNSASLPLMGLSLFGGLGV